MSSNNDNTKNSNNENIDIKSTISKFEEMHDINSETTINNSNHIEHNSPLTNNIVFYSINIKSNSDNNKIKSHVITNEINKTNNSLKNKIIANDNNNDNNKINSNIITNDNKNDNNNINNNIATDDINNDNNNIKKNIAKDDISDDNNNIKNNIIITNDVNIINKNLKNNFNTNDNNNVRKSNIIIYVNNNFNNNSAVSINCKKRAHHASAKSIDTISLNAINSRIDSNNKNTLENKSNKGLNRMKRLKQMEKNILLEAPKKECSICHEFIESYLFKIHVNIHPSEIFKWMYLGTFESASNVSDLRKLGIKYILNCAYDCKNTQLPKDITELHLKVRDEPDFEIFDYFDKANTFINKVRSKGGIILIHCKLGISRSPSFVLAYLMKYYNFSLQNALKFLRKRRPQVNPNEGFMNHLDKYQKLFKRKEIKQNDDTIPRPSNK